MKGHGSPESSADRASRTEGARRAPWSGPAAVTFGSGLEALVKASDALTAAVDAMSREVPFTVATRTMADTPIQHQRGFLKPENVKDFRPRPDAQQAAIEKLLEEGCRLTRRGRYSVSMTAPAELVASLVGGPLVVQARARRSPLRSTHLFAHDFEPPRPHELFLAPGHSLSVESGVCDAVDHLVFVPPPTYCEGPEPDPPVPGFHHVNEQGIRQLLNVPAQPRGEGIRVALVDTGFFSHPYYAKRNLNLRSISTGATPNPQVDSYGHGTAIAYNVFAVAPKVEVMGFQQTNPPQDALEEAADHGADVISCSWGYPREQVFPILQASILSIIDEGKVVLFAAGNTGDTNWPASEPEVLAVGGVYWNEQQELEACNFASGFTSSAFPGRLVPNVCGLCGELPKAIYIMLPTQPGSTEDFMHGGQSFPDFDEGTKTDGWVGMSGTSSATPQVAGVVALLLQKARAKGVSLSPARIAHILEQSAKPVHKGRGALSNAIGQPNSATGFGLVNAKDALALV